MAVFTPVSFEQAAEFWAAYDRGALVSLKPIAAGTENTNYFLNDDAVLTLFERRAPAEDLPYCIAFMQAGAAAGLPVPAPRALPDDICLRRLCDKPALVVSRLPGADVAAPSPVQAFAAGAMLARLHAAGAGLPVQPNRLGRAALLELAQTLNVAVELPAVEGLPVGAIHADYFPDNVLFVGDAVSGVIDFYFAGTDALAYDLAIALTAWNARAPDVLAGYASIRPLTPAEQHALPVLCRQAAARFYLTRLYDQRHPRPEALLHPKDPEVYRRKLQFLRENPTWPY